MNGFLFFHSKDIGFTLVSLNIKSSDLIIDSLIISFKFVQKKI